MHLAGEPVELARLRGKAARDGAGWHTCLDPGYVERFGPEGATVGPPDGTA